MHVPCANVNAPKTTATTTIIRVNASNIVQCKRDETWARPNLPGYSILYRIFRAKLCKHKDFAMAMYVRNKLPLFTRALFFLLLVLKMLHGNFACSPPEVWAFGKNRKERERNFIHIFIHMPAVILRSQRKYTHITLYIYRKRWSLIGFQYNV